MASAPRDGMQRTLMCSVRASCLWRCALVRGTPTAAKCALSSPTWSFGDMDGKMHKNATLRSCQAVSKVAGKATQHCRDNRFKLRVPFLGSMLICTKFVVILVCLHIIHPPNFQSTNVQVMKIPEAAAKLEIQLVSPPPTVVYSSCANN